jgi:hypothetical protein
MLFLLCFDVMNDVQRVTNSNNKLLRLHDTREVFNVQRMFVHKSNQINATTFLSKKMNMKNIEHEEKRKKKRKK